MSKKFKHKESYKHKCAKEVFKSWCDEVGHFKTDRNYDICWHSNRDDNAWLEYPIIENKNWNSIQCLLDETEYGYDEKGNPKNHDSKGRFIPPSYDECIKNNDIPISIIDVVLPHKGMISYCIEICHKNPVSDEKLKKLEKVEGLYNLIEIDADWILEQIEIPKVLKIKRWLI